MTDWPIEKIETHRADALARFTSQYQHAERLLDLAGISADRTQALEDVLQQLLRERWIDNAQGRQLDELGAIVGEPRLGRPDDLYRPAILVRITINRSGGEPEALIAFIDTAFGADVIAYQEMYPAKVEIYTRLSEIGPSDEVDVSEFVLDDDDNLELSDGSLLEVVTLDRGIFQDQLDQLRDVMAAGVGTLYFTESDTNLAFGTVEAGLVFGFDVDTEEPLELDDGSILEVIDGAEADDPADYIVGFGDGTIAELYEVA